MRYITCPRSHRKQVAELGFELRNSRPIEFLISALYCFILSLTLNDNSFLKVESNIYHLSFSCVASIIHVIVLLFNLRVCDLVTCYRWYYQLTFMEHLLWVRHCSKCFTCIISVFTVFLWIIIVPLILNMRKLKPEKGTCWESHS